MLWVQCKTQICVANYFVYIVLGILSLLGKAITNFFTQGDNKFFYYITPSSQLIGGSETNKKAAGSLRCGEGQNLDNKDLLYDFLRYDVRTLKHTKVTDIVDALSLIICEKSKMKGNNMFSHVLQCEAHIAKRVGRLKDKTIKNESGVRYGDAGGCLWIQQNIRQ